jgi:membrane protein
MTFGLLWVAAKLLFVSYSGYASVYVRLYGSLLEIVMLLLWVYYSAVLLLFCGTITHSLQQRAQAAASPSSVNDAA